ncbi:hypothetical protein PanWU01x14_338820, partial [Parasponia andersonii]
MFIMILATLPFAMPPSRSDIPLLGWLSKCGVINSQIRPNNHKMKTKDSGITMPPSGHLEGCHWSLLTHLITSFHSRPFSRPRSLP